MKWYPRPETQAKLLAAYIRCVRDAGSRGWPVYSPPTLRQWSDEAGYSGWGSLAGHKDNLVELGLLLEDKDNGAKGVYLNIPRRVDDIRDLLVDHGYTQEWFFLLREGGR